MKTIKKSKEKKDVMGFVTLKVKDLIQIRGGDAGSPTQRDHIL